MFASLSEFGEIGRGANSNSFLCILSQHKSVWSVAQVSALEEWRSYSKASGVLSAMTIGKSPMVMWCVDSLVAVMQFLPLPVPILVEAVAQYGWIM